MAATKNTIPTKQASRLALAALAVLVLCGAVGSLQQAALNQRALPLVLALDQDQAVTPSLFDWLPRDTAAQQNLAVMAMIAVSVDLSVPERMAWLGEARRLQEAALAQSPADPYGWLRLSYLRRVTQGNKRGAMDALNMSVSAAPYEPRIMRDRAVAWGDLESVQTPDERQQKGRMWRLAKQAEKAKY